MEDGREQEKLIKIFHNSLAIIMVQCATVGSPLRTFEALSFLVVVAVSDKLRDRDFSIRFGAAYKGVYISTLYLSCFMYLHKSCKKGFPLSLIIYPRDR